MEVCCGVLGGIYIFGQVSVSSLISGSLHWIHRVEMSFLVKQVYFH